MDGDAREPQVDPVDAWLASVSDEPSTPGDQSSAREADPLARRSPDEGGRLGEGASLLDAVVAAGQTMAEPEVPGSADAAAAPAIDRPQQRYVLFTVADSTYGVQDAYVTEVGRVPKITPVPHTPAWLRGVTSLRGDIVSVLDLRRFLGLESAPAHAGRLLVVRLLDQEFATGVLVDTVEQIVSVPADEVRPPASPVDGPLAEFLTGACQLNERFVAVLDLDRLLRSPEIRQFDDDKDATHEERSCEATI